MVAFAILTSALVAMAGVVPVAFRGSQQDSERLQAVAAGQQYLDALRQSVKKNGDATRLAA